MVTTVKPGSDKTTWFREEEQAVTGSNKTTWFRQEVYRSRRSQVQTRQPGSDKRSTGADDHKEQAVTGSANRCSVEWVLKNHILFDRLPADQVLLYNPLQNLRTARVIPGPFGIDYSNRAAHADSETVGFGAVDATLTVELQLFEPLFQIRPCLQADLFFAAFRFGLIRTNKDVPPDGWNVELISLFLQAIKAFNGVCSQCHRIDGFNK